MCKYCNGRKTMPVFNWYDRKLAGRRRCVCNGGGWYPYYDWIAEKSAQQRNAGELLQPGATAEAGGKSQS